MKSYFSQNLKVSKCHSHPRVFYCLTGGKNLRMCTRLISSCVTEKMSPSDCL